MVNVENINRLIDQLKSLLDPTTKTEGTDDMTKLDLTKPVQTQDGRSVEILKTDMKGDYPVVGVIEQVYSEQSLDKWTKDGEWSKRGSSPNLNLVNAPQKRSFWVNMGKSGSRWVFSSKEVADRHATKDRIACVKVEWKEGQFDE